jgi:hypothetical protein
MRDYQFEHAVAEARAASLAARRAPRVLVRSIKSRAALVTHGTGSPITYTGDVYEAAQDLYTQHVGDADLVNAVDSLEAVREAVCDKLGQSLPRADTLVLSFFYDQWRAASSAERKRLRRVWGRVVGCDLFQL